MTKGLPDLSHLALSGAELPVRVTPNAARNGVTLADDGTLRISVTTAPEDGRATEAARKLLAGALGVAKNRLVLTRGATARDKIFRLA